MNQRQPIDRGWSHRAKKPGWVCFLLYGSIMIGLCVGCGRPHAAPSNIDDARQLLTSTLDAWVAGETLDEQRAKEPPVYVAEDLWFGNKPLHRYELIGTGELVGTNVRFRVTLHSEQENRRGTSRDVFYLVTTTPALTIAREDR